MLRQSLFRARVAFPLRTFTTTRNNRGIIKESAKVLFGKKGEESVEQGENKVKATLDDVNIKTGKVLADGIQKAQEVVDDVDISAEDIKKGAEKVNQKTGEVLSDGIKKAQDVAEDVDAGAKDIKKGAEAANKKAGKVLADGIQDAEDLSERVQARHEVKENTKGYANLEDKGRKVPVEQNRPEDLM